MTKTRPEVSVIIVVKNGEEHLPTAIDSVLSQTHKDFELILVNDGSTDGTKAVISDHQRIDNRLKAIHLKINKGRASARNTGLKKAKGKYIVFVDADDRIPKSSIEDQIKTANKWNADIVFGRTEVFDIKSGLPAGDHYTTQIINKEKHNVTLNDYVPLVNNHQIVGRLFNRKFLRRNSIWFSDKRKNAEDVLFSFYSAFYATNISTVPETTVYYYSIGNYLNTATESKLLDARDNILETIRFSKKRDNRNLVSEMYRKGAIFAASLARAEVVYGRESDQFKHYVESLLPLVEHVDEEILNSLAPFHKIFVAALKEKDYAKAVQIWNAKRAKELKWLTHQKVTSVETISKISEPIKEPIQKSIETELEKYLAKTNNLALGLDNIYSSASWRITKPLRVVQRIFGGRKIVHAKRKYFASKYDVKVSVIVPVYNVEKYLPECIDSVLGQTLQDFELICVNDCSPDNSAEILKDYSNRDERIVVINHQTNKGQAGARNSGIDVAKGRYIYFLDSDDFLACDDALESLYDAAWKDNADEVIGGILKWYESANETTLDWHAIYLKEEIHARNLQQLPQLFANVIACNKLIRRSFLGKNSVRFNEQIRKHEDDPFSVQLHILAKRISIIPKTTYIYRQDREGSIMGTAQKSDIANRVIFCCDIFSFIESKRKYSKHRNLYYPMYAKQLIANAEMLSHFSPNENERIAQLKKWQPIIELLKGDYSCLLREQKKVFELVRKGQYTKAWDSAISISPSSEKKNKARKKPTKSQSNICFTATSEKQISAAQTKIREVQAINEKLRTQRDKVTTSLSWHITAPMRGVASKVFNFLNQ